MAQVSQQLAILDAGSQFGKVIDRRIRELGVESILLPLDTPVEELNQYRAIIISGGPESVYGEKAPKYDPNLFSLKVPMLGICYGLQLMVHANGGLVEKKPVREDGVSTIQLMNNSLLFSDLPKQQSVLLTHGDTVETLPDGFLQTADSSGLLAAAEYPQKQWYGVQFHPEVDLTEHGQAIFSNFLFKIAKFEGSFTVENRADQAVTYLQKAIGDKNVVVLVSGGVDSTVTAALLSKAIPAKQIYALHIDTGFMRQDESKVVLTSLKKLGINPKYIDASETFFNATTEYKGQQTKPLKEVTDPQQKRHIIGDTFIKVMQQVVAEWDLDPEKTMLAQGSLRPDLIESASKHISGNADVIKTHHNDTDLVRALRDAGKVVEPLQEYHKDEVRKLGTELGLPDELVWRQPFPGPGLAIRILCAQQPFKDLEFEQATKKLQQVVVEKSNDLVTGLLPVRTVGVQGDGRTFSYLAMLGTTDATVPKSEQIDWKTVFTVAKTIPTRVHQVNRIVYVFGQHDTNGIDDFVPTKLTPDVIEQLRAADAIVNQELLNHGLIKSLTQVPVTSFPISFGVKGARSIGIRTFITNDFMTGVPAVPGKQMPHQALDTIVSRILQEVPGIARVAYDLTAKPPGTTEWE
jgi:GMP synthase (glutamine-hydrolysing)